VDESCFGGVPKGKRERGAAGKIELFALFKRRVKVHTAIIPNAITETLLTIIIEKVQPGSVGYTHSFEAYDSLEVSDFHHRRINHSPLFAEERNHINGIKNFWNKAKRHLTRFTESNRRTFTGL
jgi:transposase